MTKEIIDTILNALSGDGNLSIKVTQSPPPDKEKVIELKKGKDFLVTDRNNDKDQNSRPLPSTDVKSVQKEGIPKQSVDEMKVDFSSPFQSNSWHPGFGVFSPNAMKSRIAENNLFNRFYKSTKARNEVEEEITDAKENYLISERLRNVSIEPLPESPFVNEPFPIDCLPEKAKFFILTVVNYLVVSIEAVATAFLGAIAISARGNFIIEVKKGWIEALTEYFLGALPSGNRKSAMIALLRVPFNTIESEMQQEYHHSLKANILENELLKYLKIIKKRNAKHIISEENLQPEDIKKFAKRLAMEMEPIEDQMNSINHKPRFLVDSPTLKELAMVMSRQGEAIGFFEAEGGFWKHRLHANLDILLKGYTMEFFGDETNTGSSVVMTAPCLAIDSFMQPEVVDKIFSNDEFKKRGLLGRFLTVFAPIVIGESEDLDEDLFEWYEKIIRKNFGLKRPQGKDDERTFYTLKLTPESTSCLDNFVQEIKNLFSKEEIRFMSSFIDKLAGHAVRLAGLVHLIEHEAPHQNSIDLSSMEAGIALAKFYTVHAKAAFNPNRIDGHKYAEKILHWMDRHPKSIFTERDAYRGVGESKDTVRNGLKLLEKHNYLRLNLTKNRVYCIVNPNYRFDTFIE